MLPTGDLREDISGAKRAQIIIVSKCPENLSDSEQFKITKKLNIELTQTVFFTKINYEDSIIKNEQKITLDHLNNYHVLLVTGIAKPEHLTKFLESKKVAFEHLKYKDHHFFNQNDLEKIKQQYLKIKEDKKLILTTEKDYVRTFENTNLNVFYLPIKTAFLDFEDSFNTKIKRYVE
jgi:tetraacyldisaccharide 4'-kinase